MFGKVKQTIHSLSERPNLMAALRNLGWLVFDRVFRLGVSFIVTLWLARYLAPELFGLYNYAIAFTALFSVVATFGLQSVVVQFLVDRPEQQPTILASAFLIQILGGVIAFVMATGSAFVFNANNYAVLTAVLLLSPINLFRFTDTVRYFFESNVESKQVVICENLVFLFIVSLRICMILLECSLVYFISLLILEAFLTTISFLYLFGWNRIRSLKIEIKNLLEILKVAWLLALSAGAAMLYMRVDQLMLASMIGQEAVGIYSAAVRISEIWYVFPAIIVVSVFPRILQELRIDPLRANRQISSLLTVFSIVSLIVGMFVGGYASTIIKFLFGDDYIESGPVLAIHIWSSVFVFSGIVASRWLVAMSLERVLLFSALIGVVVNVCLNYFLIPAYGIQGAAWATLIAQFISSVLVNFFHPDSRKFFWMQLSALSLVSLRQIRRWWKLNS